MSATGQPTLEQMRSRAGQLVQAGQVAEAAALYRRMLDTAPSDFDALHKLGMLRIQMNQLEDGRRLVQAALSINPGHAEAWLHLGMALQHLGKLTEAVGAYERALEINFDYPEALYCLGITLKTAKRNTEALASLNRFMRFRGDQPVAFIQRGDLHHAAGDYAAALADYESALTLRPEYIDAWQHHGATLTEMGRAEEAAASYDRALALAPGRADLHYGHGVALADMGRSAEALAAYDRAVALDPALPDAWNNRGAILRRQGKLDEALASFERALSISPDHVQSLTNRGSVYSEQRKFDLALASYDRALALSPANAEGWYNRGVVLHDLGREKEALQAYDKSVDLGPDSADAWNNRGDLLRKTGKLDEAVESFERALIIDPAHAGTLANAGAGLQNLKRYAEAGREFRKLERIAPDHKYLLGGLAVSALALCEWPTLESLAPRLAAEVADGSSIVPPFALLGLSDDAALHRLGAQNFLGDLLGDLPAVPAPAPGEKIRIAYVSNDFHAHATARLMADLFARHDRARFEVIAISFGPDEDSDMRRRLKKAFDQFHDVSAMPDAEVAALIRSLNADIAVDLKGYTEGARPGIFARRVAPVQVNYLGYPGTVAKFMDYVIADPVALPADRQEFYAEKIVHLPGSYQANDPARAIGATPSRTEAGLPEHGFVFCSFNNHWKITRLMFDIWMRLLEAVPDSVLWLLDDSGNANLRREAMARDIDPARIVFAPKLEHDAHLGRLRLADLVLDTLPYNAHTTASDALWTGIPIVTCPGQAFAGRVAASLLTAIGMLELIAADLVGYEALALSLARDPARMEAIRAWLAANRMTTPLFDAARFCEHIEAAYVTMVETSRRGDAPKGFSVSA